MMSFSRLREIHKTAFACVLLLLFLPALSGISGNLEQKIVLQGIGKVIQSSYLFL